MEGMPKREHELKRQRQQAEPRSNQNARTMSHIASSYEGCQAWENAMHEADVLSPYEMNAAPLLYPERSRSASEMGRRRMDGCSGRDLGP